MPVCYPQCAGKPYRPSNGTEGEMFQEQFCYRCRNDQNDDDPCEILTATMFYTVNAPKYPKEWVYDKDGRPTCTAFHDVQSEQPEQAVRCPDTLDLFK